MRVAWQMYTLYNSPRLYNRQEDESPPSFDSRYGRQDKTRQKQKKNPKEISIEDAKNTHKIVMNFCLLYSIWRRNPEDDVKETPHNFQKRARSFFETPSSSSSYTSSAAFSSSSSSYYSYCSSSSSFFSSPSSFSSL